MRTLVATVVTLLGSGFAGVRAEAASVAGQVYDATTGKPARSVRLQVYYDDEDLEAGQLVPAERVGAGQQGQVTSGNGSYRFDLVAGRKYRLVADVAATSQAFPSSLIPPRPGFAVDSDGDGKVVPDSLPIDPSEGPADRSYYLRFDLAGADDQFHNNHLPVDPLAVVVSLDKRADRPTAATGDVINYTLTLVNRSSRDLTAAAGRPLYILDAPARGLSYLAGKAVAHVEGEQVSFEERVEGNLRLIRLGPFDLAAGQRMKLRYQVAVGLDTRPGQYQNRAVAIDAGGVELSTEAKATVKIGRDTTLETGAVLGRVFCDSDGDGRFDAGESGVMGARVYIETGAYAVTDTAGLYHFSRVAGGTHLVKIDTGSLAGAKLTSDESQLLRLTSGLSAKANFGVSCNRVAVDTSHRRARLVAAGDRPPKPGPGVPGPTPGGAKPIAVTGAIGDFSLAVAGERVELPVVVIELVAHDRWRESEPAGGDNLKPVPAAGYSFEPPRWRTAVPSDLALERWELVIARIDKGSTTPLRKISGEGRPPAEIVWDGLGDDGQPLAGDTLYSVQLLVAGDQLEAASRRQVFGISFGLTSRPEESRVTRGKLFGGTEKAPTATPELEKLVAALAAEIGADDTLVVESHWDGTGDRLATVARTLKEANLVVDLLVRAGVGADRVKARGRGSLDPLVDPPKTKAAKAQNRRLVVSITWAPSATAGQPIPEKLPGEAAVTIGGETIGLDGGGKFATEIIPVGPVRVELVAADGRRSVITLPLGGADPAADSPPALPATEPKSQPSEPPSAGGEVELTGDLASNSFAVNGRALPSQLLAIDVNVRDSAVVSDGAGGLAKPLGFELRAPAELVARWGLVVSDEAGATLFRVTASGAGLTKWYHWDGKVDGEPVLESGKSYGYQLVVTTAAGHRAASPRRSFTVDPTGAPEGWSDITASAPIFSGNGGLRAGVKNQLSRLVDRAGRRSGDERYAIAVTAELPAGASVTDRRLGLAARKASLRNYLRRLGLADERYTIEVEAGDSDSLTITAAGAAAVAQPTYQAAVLVNRKAVALSGGKFTTTLTAAAGAEVELDVTVATGQRMVWKLVPFPAVEPAQRETVTEAGGSEVDSDSRAATAPALRVFLPAEDVELERRELAVTGETTPGNRVFVGGAELVEVPVAADGRFATVVDLPAGKSQLAVQSVDAAGNRSVIEWPVAVAERQLFVLALAEGIVSTAYTPRGWFDDRAYLDGMTEDSSLDIGSVRFHGRVAAYVKARFDGGDTLGPVEVTGHLDTARPSGSGAFFTELVDPSSSRDLPVFGDSAEEVSEANSRGKLFLRATVAGGEAVIGSIATALESGDLFRFDRTVAGARVALDRPIGDHHVEVTAVAASGDSGLASDVNYYRATGGSLYYLRHGYVIEGSERVRVIVRDRDTGMVIGSSQLHRNRDYAIDYPGGRVMLVNPVAAVADTSWLLDNFDASTTPLSGHPVYLEVGYEHADLAATGQEMGGITVRDTIGRVSFGGGVVGEERAGQGDYSLWGIDATVRLGAGSRVSAELAGSHAREAVHVLSQDGGLTFLSLDQTSLTTAADGGIPGLIDTSSLGGDGLQLGWKLSGEVDLDDFVGDSASPLLKNTRLAVSLQDLDRGFSAGGAVFEQGRFKLGLSLVHDLARGDRISIRHLAEVAQLPRVGPTEDDVAANLDPMAVDERATYLTSVQWARRSGRWLHRVEAAHQRLSSTALLADGSPALDARRLGLGGSSALAYSDRLTIRVGQQLMVGLGDQDPRLDPIVGNDSSQRGSDTLAGFTSNLGADLRLTETVALGADWYQRWNGDNAAQVGLKSALGRGSMYVKERVESLAGGTVSTTIVGAEDRFGASSNGAGRQYGEYQLEHGILGARNRAVLGLGYQWQLAPGLRVATGFEHQQVFGGFLPDGTPVGHSQRNILHGGGEYTPIESLKLTASVELRLDDGSAQRSLVNLDPRNVALAGGFAEHGGTAAGAPFILPPGDWLQILSGVGASWKAAEDYTLLGRLRLGYSGMRPDEGDFATVANYSEATVGVAYRPLAEDWLQLLGRYSYLEEMRPITTIGERLDAASHILALIPLVDLPSRITLGGKLALKRTGAARGSGEEEVAATTNALLLLARAGYRFYGKWDASGEARWLYLGSPNGSESRIGTLWEAGYRLNDWVRFGIGYNLSHFSDNEFDDLQRDSHGFFVRVTGQY